MVERDSQCKSWSSTMIIYMFISSGALLWWNHRNLEKIPKHNIPEETSWTSPPQERVEEQQILLSDSEAKQESSLPTGKQISKMQLNLAGQLQWSAWKIQPPQKMNL